MIMLTVMFIPLHTLQVVETGNKCLSGGYIDIAADSATTGSRVGPGGGW